MMKPSAFKVKVDGHWEAYAPEANDLLKKAFKTGVPSVRFSVKDQPYKFDFKRMRQKNMLTGDLHEMCAPLCLKAPDRPLIPQLGPRPIFVVKVPAGGPGNVVKVPSPKKLGKSVRVTIPDCAQEGQLIFAAVPPCWEKKALYGTIGVTAGAAIITGVLVSDLSGAAGAATAAAGSLAAVAGGAAAPFVLGGVAVAGALAASAAVVHVTSKHPAKAVATAALAIGGLAGADYVAEHGVLDAAGDLVETAGDALSWTSGAASDAVHVVEENSWEDWLENGGENWLEDGLEDYTADIVASLF